MDSDMTAQKKKVPANSNTKKHDFKTNDHVVYPTHGVGRIARVEEQEVAGAKLELPQGSGFASTRSRSYGRKVTATVDRFTADPLSPKPWCC